MQQNQYAGEREEDLCQHVRQVCHGWPEKGGLGEAGFWLNIKYGKPIADQMFKREKSADEAGCNEPHWPVELGRGGQHQHRSKQHQGLHHSLHGRNFKQCSWVFSRLGVISRWVWTSTRQSKRIFRFIHRHPESSCFISMFPESLISEHLSFQVTEASGDD